MPQKSSAPNHLGADQLPSTSHRVCLALISSGFCRPVPEHHQLHNPCRLALNTMASPPIYHTPSAGRLPRGCHPPQMPLGGRTWIQPPLRAPRDAVHRLRTPHVGEREVRSRSSLDPVGSHRNQGQNWMEGMDRNGDGMISAREWDRFHSGTPSTRSRMSISGGGGVFGRKDITRKARY